MKISLENHLRNKIDEVESMHSFEIATDTIRCWIDEYNEQFRQYNVSSLLNAFVDFYNNRKLSHERINYDEIDIFLESI